MISGESMPGRLLPARHSERPKAPDRVWDWQSYASWRGVIWELLADTVDESVRRAFLSAPPEYVVGDNLSWLDGTILSARGIEVDSKDLLAERLVRRFKSFRAVHGTRTSDVASYYAEGLRPLRPENFHEKARAIFLSGEFPELTAAHLDEAIREVGPDLREGRVYLDGNERMLVQQCGHYLLYGSEYLLAIASHLPGGRDYRQILKRVGQATVFVCDVPLAMVSEHAILEYAGTALEMVFQELLECEDYVSDRWRGAGICLFEPLPSRFIVGHYHLTAVRDPLC